MDMILEREVEIPKSVMVKINLKNFELSLQHQQLKEILKILKRVQLYQKMAM